MNPPCIRHLEIVELDLVILGGFLPLVEEEAEEEKENQEHHTQHSKP